MAPKRVDRAKRRAAGHVMLGLFHLLESSVVHPLRMITDASVRHTSLWQGLTPKEVELILRKRQELSETADLFRRLGWRLLKERDE